MSVQLHLFLTASNMLLQAGRRVAEVLPMRSEEDLMAWGRLDDVIMGGRSSSGLAPAEGGAVWSGELITEGGGFCGTRTQARPPSVLKMSQLEPNTSAERSQLCCSFGTLILER